MGGGGGAVTKFTNLYPDPSAIHFVKLIYFNVNTVKYVKRKHVGLQPAYVTKIRRKVSTRIVTVDYHRQ